MISLTCIQNFIYECNTLYIYAFAVIGSLLNTRTSKFYRPCNLFNTY